MADVEEAAPPQLAGLALPPERGRAAWAVYRFLSSASLLAVFFLLAAGWTCSVANAFRIAARSSWAALAEAYMDVGLYSLSLSVALVFVLVMALILHSIAVWQLLRRRERRGGEIRQISREWAATIVALERERLEGTTEEDEGDDDPVMGSCGPVTVIVLLVGMAVGFLILLLIAPAPGSWQEWLGSVLFDGSFFLVSLMFAYVVFPSTIAAVIAEWATVRDIAAIVTYLYVG